jgi:DNA-directed RNA polymerase
MRFAISPNFVHSCDAAHLVRTVNLAKENNINHLAMVHDSFACHATDTPALREILRHAFVQVHSETNPLRTFYEEVRLQVTDPDSIPEPPDCGDLDIEQVLEADFFFC